VIGEERLGKVMLAATYVGRASTFAEIMVLISGKYELLDLSLAFANMVNHYMARAAEIFDELGYSKEEVAKIIASVQDALAKEAICKEAEELASGQSNL